MWDLEHPERFYLIFTRPQWRSWLVKGAFIIAGYTLVLALHFIASWAGWRSFQIKLMIAGVPLSILTAVYTAYLFAQAKARDMWQNPLLPPHLLVQSLLLGSAVLLPLVVSLKGAMVARRFYRYYPCGSILAVVVPGNLEFHSSADGLGRSLFNSSDGPRTSRDLGDGERAL